MTYKNKTVSKQAMQKQMKKFSAQYWNLTEKPRSLEKYNEQKQMAANYFLCRDAMDGI